MMGIAKEGLRNMQKEIGAHATPFGVSAETATILQY
jgi:hypothetical protein